MQKPSSTEVVTTVIPTFRRPKTLRRAIQSVLNQTYPYINIFVYDNKSEDETSAVVSAMSKEDPRVFYRCHDKNIGAFQNLQYGMEHVETELFSFLSDDDILLPDFYQTAIESFQRFPDSGFFSGLTITMTEEGMVRDVPLSHWSGYGYFIQPDGIREMISKPHPTWTGTVFRKKAVKEIGRLDQEVGPPADLDLALRIAARFPFVTSETPCAIFVSHQSSSCESADYRSAWPGWLKMIRNLTEDSQITKDIRVYADHVLMDKLMQRLLKLGFRSIIKKDFKEAYKTSEILYRECGQKLKAAALYSLTRISEFFPPAYYALYYSGEMFWLLRNYRYQKRFGRYVKFLSM